LWPFELTEAQQVNIGVAFDSFERNNSIYLLLRELRRIDGPFCLKFIYNNRNICPLFFDVLTPGGWNDFTSVNLALSEYLHPTRAYDLHVTHPTSFRFTERLLEDIERTFGGPREDTPRLESYFLERTPRGSEYWDSYIQSFGIPVDDFGDLLNLD